MRKINGQKTGADVPQFFPDNLSNSGPAIRLYGEGRATGPPESVSGAIGYAKNSQSHVDSRSTRSTTKWSCTSSLLAKFAGARRRSSYI